MCCEVENEYGEKCGWPGVIDPQTGQVMCPAHLAQQLKTVLSL